MSIRHEQKRIERVEYVTIQRAVCDRCESADRDAYAPGWARVRVGNKAGGGVRTLDLCPDCFDRLGLK